MVPFSFAGLAAAGVELPGAVVEPFESVGITLPNQDGEAEETAFTTPTAAGETAAAPRSSPRPARDGDRDRPKPEARKRRDRRSAQGQAAGAGAPETNVAPTSPAAPVPTVEGETSGPAGDGGAAGGGAADAANGPVRSILDDVGELLEEPLLPLIGQGSKPKD